MPLAAYRSSMADLISEVRLMIADPSGASQQFTDLQIQNRLDESREDIRYEPLQIAPTIVNLPSTNNQAQTIFADYYSKYQWWENDVVLQGINTSTQAAWVVLTPLEANYITGYWKFELNTFTSGTVPGQYPPVFATGKVYDLNYAAADLLKLWAATLAGAYNISVDGQSLQRSQLMTAKLTLETYYRRQAKPRVAKLSRGDIMPELDSMRYRLMDSGDTVKGA